MVTKLQKWGNSLGLRIPKSFASEARVAAGSVVDIRVDRGTLTIRPVRRANYVLADLLKKVKSGSLHQEVPTGKRVGREVW